MIASKFEVWKERHFIGRPQAALSLATPLCGTILAEWMPNRDILVDWPGRRDKALKTGTVPAKTERMVCLSIYLLAFYLCFVSKTRSFCLQITCIHVCWLSCFLWHLVTES